jgi:hypothetical protein
VTRTGPAIVYIKHHAYVTADCQYDGAAVTFTGRLRVIDSVGERLYEPVTLTVPVGRLERVEWQEGPAS